MHTIQAARSVLQDAERRLRELMTECIKEQRYGDLAGIAGIADGVARLALRESPAEACTPGAPYPNTTLPHGTAMPKANAKTKVRANAGGASRSGGYPRFEREGDKLVKVGWSKKKRQAYEHRASKHAVMVFVRHLSESVRAGELFAIEELLPVPDSASGSEVPAYQIYLTLAWLRGAGAIEKRGRDGYVVRSKTLLESPTGLDELWMALPVRK